MVPALDVTGTPYCKAIILFSMINLVNSISNMKLSVPEAVTVGDSVTLSCLYDLQNETLYLMRWTMDGTEFFRYVEKEEPAATSFPSSGIQVDMRKSNSHNVTIRSLTLNQTGNYQCEVSADAPHFHTLTDALHMQVVVLPDTEPVMNIYGAYSREDNSRYIHYSDEVKATCIASPSLPTVNFTWTINDAVFPATTSGYRDNNGIHSDNWETREAWSELVFKVDNYFFAAIRANKLHGPQSLRIRCETNVFSLYRGAAALSMDIVDDSWTVNAFGGIVSPTTDLRGGSDPGNSALTGCGVQVFQAKVFLFSLIALVLRLLSSPSASLQSSRVAAECGAVGV